MRQLIARIDRRLAVTGLVLFGSTLLLVAGLVSILVTLGDDNVNLPNEGSLQQILDQRRQAAADQPARDGQGPAPTRLVIPRLYVDAPVLAMGLDGARNPEVPDSGGDVAWYTFSASPGRGSNAVFSGHVDWYYWGTPAKGVFYHLRELQIGDEVEVTLEDGSTLRYRVTGNVAVAYDDPNVSKVMDPTSKDVITLITCGGSWLRDYSNSIGGSYSHRVIVRAERALELATDQPSSGG